MIHQEVRFCTAGDGVRVAFATAGKGPPIVRIANWLTHLELDWESQVWRHWLEPLASGRTLVRLDLRGSGLSDRAVGPLTLDTWVADLAAVADAAGLDRFPVMGLCQGAAIAVAFAARHPERVSRLVLYGGFARGAFAAGANPRMRRDAAALAQLIEVGWGRDVPAFRAVFANLLMPGAAAERARELTELQRRAASTEEASRLWRAFHAIDVTALARLVRCPTLVVHAAGDALVPFEEGRELAALVPGARLLALEGQNHVLLEDEPAWPVFLRELERFLEGDEAEGPVPGLGPRDRAPLPTLEGHADAVPGLGPSDRVRQLDGDAAQGAFPELSPREREVLDLIARGYDNDRIARQLTRSPHTVRNHITSIFSKLAVGNRAQAIVRAREAGLGRGDARDGGRRDGYREGRGDGRGDGLEPDLWPAPRAWERRPHA